MPRLLGLLALLLLAGCGPEGDGALRFTVPTAPVTLDPRQATDAASTRLNRLLYRSLVDFDGRFRAVPDLARWERPEPTRYRFVLGEEGRRFHDGTRLTARDVKATYDSILDPDGTSPHRGSLAMVADIRVVDADRVDFLLKRPDPLFPGRLVVGIVPAARAAGEPPLGEAPVGSGPFALESWPEEGRLTLRRVADGRRVEVSVVKDPTVRVLKLLRGEADLVQGDMPPEMVAWLDQREDVVVRRARGSNFTYLGFNLEDPLTGQRPLRAAVAHALDRPAIIDHVLGRAARPASALLLPGHWAGHSGLSPYRHDPAAARALLAEVRRPAGEALAITYKTSSRPLRVRLATIIQHQLARVGLDVDVRSYDWGTFYGDIKAGRFQMYSLSWVGIKMPDIFRYVFHSESLPPAGANRGRYRNPRVDELIDRAEAATDLETQARLYRELQAVLHRELPYVPLWYEDHVALHRPHVRGYRVPLDGNYDGLAEVRWGDG